MQQRAPRALVQAVMLSMFTPRSHSTMTFGLLRFACHQRSRYSPAIGKCESQAGTGMPPWRNSFSQRTKASPPCAI